MLADDDGGRLATRVGAVALIIVIAAIGFAVFVLPQLEFGEHIRIRVELAQTGGMREGAPLVAGGRAIGTVEAIALQPGGHGNVVAIVALAARDAGRVPIDGEIFVASRGPLSERYLEVAPPRVRHSDGTSELAPPARAVRDGEQLRGIDPPSIDRMLQRTLDDLSTASRFLDDVRPAAHDLATQVAALRESAGALAPTGSQLVLAAELGDLLATVRQTRDGSLGGAAGLDHLARTIGAARETLAQARATLAAIDPRVSALAAAWTAARGSIDARVPGTTASLEQTIDRVNAAIAKLDPLLATAQDLAARLARGEGSLGRLMTDPEFPEDTKELGKIIKRNPWRLFGHPED